MNHRIPLTTDDLIINVSSTSVHVSAHAFTPFSRPAFGLVTLKYFGYSEEEAVADFLQSMESSGYFRDEYRVNAPASSKGVSR